jgi:hypothetical protein
LRLNLVLPKVSHAIRNDRRVASVAHEPRADDALVTMYFTNTLPSKTWSQARMLSYYCCASGLQRSQNHFVDVRAAPFRRHHNLGDAQETPKQRFTILSWHGFTFAYVVSILPL